jgi:hypothetical protein
MEVILKHKTSDGTSYHEVDLVNRKYKITTLETELIDESITTKKWGPQQNFIDKLILKEIESLNDKMFTQKMTIAECIRYNSEDNLDITKEKLNMNRERLEFLKKYEHEVK